VALFTTAGREEAVFSSSEDRIRAGRVPVEVRRPSIVPRDPSSHRAGWVNRTAASLFSIFFPSDCQLCGFPLLNISRLPVCPECLDRIQPIQGKVCSICGERVLSSYLGCDEDGLRRCPVCRRIDHAFHRAIAYGSYDDGLRELIHLLKYNGVRPAAGVLGRMLSEILIGMVPSLEQPVLLLVPVPLFREKRRQRGFNQAELIAQAAIRASISSERFHLAPEVLRRVRATHSQIGLTSHQRRENVRGAFAVTHPEQVTGREVVLVDDVYTTGTTASECARVLRRAGASRVWVATVARTLKMASKYEEKQGFGFSEFQGVAEKADTLVVERQAEGLKV
jgi:ComF family protein